MDRSTPTQFVVAVVQSEDAHDLVRRLVDAGFGATRIDAAGGFLRRANAVVLIATDGDRLPALLAVVRETCRTRVVARLPPLSEPLVAFPSAPIDVEVGGAVVFVLPIERTAFLGGVADPVRAAAARQRAGGDA